jgi:hypothetical protein
MRLTPVAIQEKEEYLIQIILTHNLGDGVRPISELVYIPMGSCEALFLQMQLDLITHLKFVWYSILIVVLSLQETP